MKRPAPGTTTNADSPAAQAVSALEDLPIHADHQAELAAARQAVDQGRAAAIAVAFPFVSAAVTAEAVAIFNHASGAFSRPTMDRELLQLHAEAQAAAPSVAAVVRTHATLKMIDAALSWTISDAAERAARLASFCSGIAGQCAALDKDSPEVVMLATTLPALEARISAVLDRCAAHAETRRQADARARKARAKADRAARAAEVINNRQWFNDRAAALFMYNNEQTTGARYAIEVLSGDPASLPLHRVRHAIAARKTHEPDYTCPAWQTDRSPAEQQAYRAAIADLHARLDKLATPAFGCSQIGGAITGGKLAEALLALDSDGSVPPSNVRQCIAAVKRFDPAYEWRGPNFNGFEIDEEAERQIIEEEKNASFAANQARLADDIAAAAATPAARAQDDFMAGRKLWPADR